MIADLSPTVNKSPTSICGALRPCAKTALVALLSWLLAWRPTLAILLGRLVLRIWPGFRRA